MVLKGKDDQVTVIGAGVTLHEALAAADMLKKEKISIRVLDPFTIKPLDRKLILDSARATKGRILTVEDHYYEGNPGCTRWIGKVAGTKEPRVDVTLNSSEESLPLPLRALAVVRGAEPASSCDLAGSLSQSLKPQKRPSLGCNG